MHIESSINQKTHAFASMSMKTRLPSNGSDVIKQTKSRNLVHCEGDDSKFSCSKYHFGVMQGKDKLMANLVLSFPWKCFFGPSKLITKRGKLDL